MPKQNLIDNNENYTLQEILARYLKHCESKNLAERTKEDYEYKVNKFISHVDAKHINDINPRVVEDYRLHLMERDLSDSSVNSKLKAVRAYLYYAMRLGFLEHGFKVKMIKEKKKVKETYTKKELELLLEKPDLENCGFAEYRTWVTINWLLATGNRARTLRNIKIKDLRLDEGMVRLREVKNRTEQIIPVPKHLVEIIIEYLDYREGEPGDYLFCTIYGNKICSSTLTSCIRRYNKRRGVEKTSTHLFRHTFAKLWIKNGGDIFRLQKMLGHKSIDMVNEYVNMFGRDLKENFEKFNPLNQFAKHTPDKSTIKMER